MSDSTPNTFMHNAHNNIHARNTQLKQKNVNSFQGNAEVLQFPVTYNDKKKKSRVPYFT